MKHDFKKKVALITGSSRGIGFASALALGELGCKVVICSKTKGSLEKAKKILDEKKIIYFAQTVNLNNLLSSSIFFKNVIKKFKKVDILINNFGGEPKNVRSNFVDTKIDIWTQTINMNLNSSVLFTKLVLPYMKKNKWGRIINVSSLSAYNYRSRPWYTIAKKTQIDFIKSLSTRKEYVQSGITFNSISPGSVLNEGSEWDVKKKQNLKKFNKDNSNSFVIGRPAEPMEVARVIKFLSSMDSSYINGVNIKIDGGQSNMIYDD